MFMLTLQFDFTRLNGRFSGDATVAPGPLTTSMNWLRLIPDAAHPEPRGCRFPRRSMLKRLTGTTWVKREPY